MASQPDMIIFYPGADNKPDFSPLTAARKWSEGSGMTEGKCLDRLLGKATDPPPFRWEELCCIFSFSGKGSLC
jgi:hypothetical protein